MTNTAKRKILLRNCLRQSGGRDIEVKTIFTFLVCRVQFSTNRSAPRRGTCIVTEQELPDALQRYILGKGMYVSIVFLGNCDLCASCYLHVPYINLSFHSPDPISIELLHVREDMVGQAVMRSIRY